MKYLTRWSPWIAWNMVPPLLLAMTLAWSFRVSAWAEDKKYRVNFLQQTALGELSNGRYTLKAVELIMAPGAEIPSHRHEGSGIRYVLEGAITISWKGGETQTLKAGSTYFEGPAENHPAGTFSAKNAGSGPCRVLIIELVPTTPK